MHPQVFHLLYRRHVLSAISSIVLVTFTWFLVFPTALAAQVLSTSQFTATPSVVTSSEDAEFLALLAQIEAKLIRFQNQPPFVDEVPIGPTELARFLQRLAYLDTRVRQQFAQTVQHLQEKNLPKVIHQRHYDAITTFNTTIATLRQQLDDLAAASTPQMRHATVAQAVQHLRAMQSPRISQAFNSSRLPFRTPDGSVREAKETTEDYETALTPLSVKVASVALPLSLLAAPVAALPSTPTPDDLTPTEDVQLTDEIQELAMSLGNNPVQISNWVHDYIEFMPTYGSIQGAHMTLQTKRGNAFDTASLLVALLRAAHIPARYVYGTVQIPIDQVMNWVGGVTKPEAALQVLGQGSIPYTAMVQGGVITAVKLEHVWVEAWVDFFPSRGAKHVQGDTWIPLDASFKQYQYTAGVNLQNQIPFDVESLVTQLTTSAQVNAIDGWVSGLDHAALQQALTTYQQQANAYVTTQQPNVTVGDVLGTQTIIPSRRPVLAASLPYTLIARGPTWWRIPDQLRHQFRFLLYDSALDRLSESPVLVFQQSLPMLAGKKLTLSFAPATQEDADLIASYLPQSPAATDENSLNLSAFPQSLPGYLIRLLAEVRLDGQVVARGGTFTMGHTLVSTQGLYDPFKGWQEVKNAVVAGEYQAWALNVAGIAGSQVQALQAKLTATKVQLEMEQVAGLTKEELLGDLLYMAVLSYFAVNDITDHLSARAGGVVAYRHPSFGHFTLVAQPHYVFGIPRIVSFLSVEMDIDRLVSTVESKTNSHGARIAYVQQSGLRQSALEHLIPEQLFTDAQHPGEAVSAVKALIVASEEGQRLYTISSENIAYILPKLNLNSAVKTAIQDAVNTRHVALVSSESVTIGQWTGVGYILLDPATGSGAYLISGGANGGALILAGSGLALAATHIIGLAVMGGGIAVGLLPGLAAGLFVPLSLSLILLGLILYLSDGGEFMVTDGLGAIALLDATVAIAVYFELLSGPLFPLFAIFTAIGVGFWIKARFFS